MFEGIDYTLEHTARYKWTYDFLQVCFAFLAISAVVAQQESDSSGHREKRNPIGREYCPGFYNFKGNNRVLPGNVMEKKNNYIFRVIF